MRNEKRCAYDKKWRAANKDKVREQKRRSREKHKERRNAMNREQRAVLSAKLREYRKRWEAKNPDMVRAAVIRKTLRAKRKAIESGLRLNYNITSEDYLAVDAMQGHGCMICGAAESKGRSKRLHVDHDHVTGCVRGLLCYYCNSSLGFMKDNEENLRRAAAYLEGFRAESHNPEDWAGRVRSVLGRLSKKGRKKGSTNRMGATQSELGLAGGDLDRLGLAVPAGIMVEERRSLYPTRNDVATR